MKIVEVITDAGHIDTILSIAEQYEAYDVWYYSNEDERHVIRLLVAGHSIQKIIDNIQKQVIGSDQSRLVVLPVEASVPQEEPSKKSSNTTQASREALYQEVSKNITLDLNYILLVILSTIVAALGMLEDNIAVVIGAMVIAPLLGPNIALALGTALGNNKLIIRAMIAFLVGIFITLITSFLLTHIYTLTSITSELLARTNISYSAIAMALASGAAAALSMTTGLSSVLVGVMVAVAILPPAATVGLMLGYQHYELAFAAFILLAINVVCVNLSAIIVFTTKNIRPRTSSEQRHARRLRWLYLLIWFTLLSILIYVVYTTNNLYLN